MTASSIAAQAEALLARHGALLRPVMPVEGHREAEACDALDAARARLQGRERPEPDQLALDLSGLHNK